MKAVCILQLLGTISLFGCKSRSASPLAQTQTALVSSVSGSYYRGDGLGYNISLDLKPDGHYDAVWHGCLGRYGSSHGRWSTDGAAVNFMPGNETGMLTDHLRSLTIVRADDSMVLVLTDPEDRKFYEKYGISRYSCYQPTQRAAPQSTPRRITGVPFR